MSHTADRYAKALFELVKEEDDLEAVQTSLNAIRDLIASSADFRMFLTNPILSYEERTALLKTLFEGKIPGLVLKFLLFITYKKRLVIIKNIIESFDELYLAATGQQRAYVTTALPIEEADKNFINQRLSDKFRIKMLTQWQTDASLIGGFRIFTQDKMYDYSFSNQLNNFFQQATRPA